MNQVNHQLINELSLEDKLGREKQLASQLAPLKQQLETVRSTGPVNGIGEEHLEALIGQHEELIGELRESIDADISPDALREQAQISSKVEDYLARHGKVHQTSAPSNEFRAESLSPNDMKQISLMRDAVAKPYFGANKSKHDTWQSSLADIKAQKTGIFNLLGTKEA